MVCLSLSVMCSMYNIYMAGLLSGVSPMSKKHRYPSSGHVRERRLKDPTKRCNAAEKFLLFSSVARYPTNFDQMKLCTTKHQMALNASSN